MTTTNLMRSSRTLHQQVEECCWGGARRDPSSRLFFVLWRCTNVWTTQPDGTRCWYGGEHGLCFAGWLSSCAVCGSRLLLTFDFLEAPVCCS